MNKKILLILLIILAIMGYSENKHLLASKGINIFDEAIKITEAIPSESGIKVIFQEDKVTEEYYLNILEKLNMGSFSTSVSKDEETSCLEFRNDTITGYIESMRYDNHNVVTIEICVKSKESMQSELKNKVVSAIGKSENKITIYEYLKAKVLNRDLNKVNNDMTTLLKRLKAVNIDTVEIENGYSTVANTKRYSSIETNEKSIDFNYAVCRYDTGNYIIMGTPVIMTTY